MLKKMSLDVYEKPVINDHALNQIHPMMYMRLWPYISPNLPVSCQCWCGVG